MLSTSCPGCILLPFSGYVVGSTHNDSEEDISETHRLYRRNNNWSLNVFLLQIYLLFFNAICCAFHNLNELPGGSAGMADLILVNSKFTASTFANTFKNLDERGIKPAVLYPAVNVDQFDEPHTFK